MITFGVVLHVPKFCPSRVIDSDDTIGLLGGHRAVTTGTIKLTILTLLDFPDLADTTISRPPPEPAGDLQMIVLDEIQNEDCIKEFRKATFKDI
jgi:hypothetical protein